VTHTYASAGTYTVTLTVTDPDGLAATDSLVVTVVAGNQPPTADAGADINTNVNVAVNLDGTGSSDADGTIASYAWDFDDGTTGTGATVSHTYDTVGTYEVTLTVTDDDGDTDTDIVLVTVTVPENQLPMANAGADVTEMVGVEVSFDGSASSDADGTIASYNWDFGDDTTGTGATPAHTYSAAGTYTVSLTVIDNDSGSATDTLTATITNTAPSANAGAYQQDFVGVAVTFDGSGSFDADGHSLTYSWDMGDGTTATGETVTHTYDDPNIYLVELTVEDEYGLQHTNTTFIIVDEVTNNSPTASAGTVKVKSADVSEIITFDGSGSEDPDGDDLSFSWDFGDTTTADTATIDHAYTEGGIYVVTLDVSDNRGGSDDDTLVAMINALPVATLEIITDTTPVSSIIVDTNETVEFDGTLSCDPDGSLSLWEWDFGDGVTTSNGGSQSHSYSEPGIYTVALTVTDTGGATDTDEVTVTVVNQDPTADAGENVYPAAEADFQLDGTASIDPDGSIVDYSWQLDGDLGSSDTATGATPTLNLATADTYHVTLTVTDDDGATATDSIVVIVANLDEADELPPVVSLPAPSVDPETQAALDELGVGGSKGITRTATGETPDVYALTGRPIFFDASRSYDPGGLQTGIDADASLTYSWDFTDDPDNPATVTSAVATHIYQTESAADETYIVVLTVTDDEDATDSMTLYVKVLLPPNKRPSADAGPSQIVYQDEVVTFDGSASSDPDGTIAAYDWDFDGLATDTGVSPTYTFTDPGTYLVTLTVTDDGSPAKNDSDTMIMVVQEVIINQPPIADAGLDVAVLEDEPVTFDGTGSFDADGTIVSYEWAYNGTPLSTDATFTYAFTTDGIYTVTLTVTDDEDDVDTDTIEIVVTDPPPVVFSVDVTYQGTNAFDQANPIILSIYDQSSPTWIDDGPVVTRSIANNGKYGIRVSDMVPAYDPANTEYALLLLHNLDGTGNPETNYWAFLDMNAGTEHLSFDPAVYTPLETNTPYTCIFSDDNTADLNVIVW
jgi:PKD repeat protein